MENIYHDVFVIFIDLIDPLSTFCLGLTSKSLSEAIFGKISFEIYRFYIKNFMYMDEIKTTNMTNAYLQLALKLKRKCLSDETKIMIMYNNVNLFLTCDHNNRLKLLLDGEIITCSNYSDLVQFIIQSNAQNTSSILLNQSYGEYIKYCICGSLLINNTTLVDMLLAKFPTLEYAESFVKFFPAICDYIDAAQISNVLINYDIDLSRCEIYGKLGYDDITIKYYRKFVIDTAPDPFEQEY